MADLNATLTDAGTVWSTTGPTTLYQVKVSTATGKKATVAQTKIGYIELITTENGADVKRYYKVDATEAAVEYTTTATDIGSFYSENTAVFKAAYLYNGQFEDVT